MLEVHLGSQDLGHLPFVPVPNQAPTAPKRAMKLGHAGRRRQARACGNHLGEALEYYARVLAKLETRAPSVPVRVRGRAIVTVRLCEDASFLVRVQAEDEPRRIERGEAELAVFRLAKGQWGFVSLQSSCERAVVPSPDGQPVWAHPILFVRGTRAVYQDNTRRTGRARPMRRPVLQPPFTPVITSH